MVNLFNNIPVYTTLKETEDTIFINNNEVIPEWLALRYIDISLKSYSGKRELNRISTTEFSKSDKQILLEQQRIQNGYKITVDVEDIVSSVLGTIVHEGILQTEPERQEKSIGKWVISGQADRINNNTIYDLKHTSIYSGKNLLRELDLYPKYHEMSLEDLQVKCPSIFKYLSQLAIYNWLYNLDNDIGYITFIFNNWTFKDKQDIKNKNMQIEFKLPNIDKIEQYLINRLNRLKSYQDTGYLPDCDDNTLGISTTRTYKIVKYGKTRAVNGSGGSFNTLNEASIAQLKFPNTEIKETVITTEPTLCLNWCKFNKEGVCEQGQKIKEAYETI
jgi:hypothetical protein